jgi:hypothetical protein
VGPIAAKPGSRGSRFLGWVRGPLAATSAKLAPTARFHHLRIEFSRLSSLEEASFRSYPLNTGTADTAAAIPTIGDTQLMLLSQEFAYIIQDTRARDARYGIVGNCPVLSGTRVLRPRAVAEL